MPVSADAVRKVALALPDVTEAPSYGTPGFKIRGKLFARLHQDGESLVIRVELFERELLLQTNPQVFFLTDHYAGHPWVLVRLSVVTPALLRQTLRQAWETAQTKPRKAARRE